VFVVAHSSPIYNRILTSVSTLNAQGGMCVGESRAAVHAAPWPFPQQCAHLQAHVGFPAVTLGTEEEEEEEEEEEDDLRSRHRIQISKKRFLKSRTNLTETCTS
jgi:hypothetical protein